jgi:hypothetical protein
MARGTRTQAVVTPQITYWDRIISYFKAGLLALIAILIIIAIWYICQTTANYAWHNNPPEDLNTIITLIEGGLILLFMPRILTDINSLLNRRRR